MKYKLTHISILLLIIITINSCGIYSFTGADYGTAKTVSIDFFPNRAPLVNPTLSQTFTEQLRDKFMNETPLQLVEEDGDLHFEGEIVGYNIKPTNITAKDFAAENRLTITIRVKFSNSTNPKYDYDKKFSWYADYDANQSFVAVENQLVEEILEKIIDDIFNQAVVNW